MNILKISNMRVILPLLIGCIFCLTIWSWLGRYQDIVDVPSGRFECLSYTPSNGNNPPYGDGFYLPDSFILDDLKKLSKLTGCVRTYSALGMNARVIPLAEQLGLKVLMGIWIGTDPQQNEEDIQAGIALAKAHPNSISMIIVGNEVLLRGEQTAANLIPIIQRVKAETGLTVTYADVFDFWKRNPELANTVDIVTIHVLPYWDDNPVDIDATQTRVKEMLAEAKQLFAGKQLQIGEIGWPSAGRTRGGATPSVLNEARFLRDFANQSHKIGIPYNIIEGIDQPWKRVSEGTVGGAWGMLDANREAKFPLTGPLSAYPDWQWLAGFSIVWLILAALYARQASLARWYGLTITSLLNASLLWLYSTQALECAFGWLGTLWMLFTWLLCLVGTLLCPMLFKKPSSANRWLNIWRYLVLATATYAAFSMAIDGRYRDFVSLAYVAPLLSLFLLDSTKTKQHSPAIGWMGFTLLLCGPCAMDSWQNLDSWRWMAMCLLFAWYCRTDMLAEWRYLRSVLQQYTQRNKGRDAA